MNALEPLHSNDIYEVLGVTPDASAQLAKEMYWSKLEALALTATGQANPDTRSQIDALNEALAIVLDQQMRNAYDGARSVPTIRQDDRAPGSDEPGRLRQFLRRLRRTAAVISGAGIVFVGSGLAGFDPALAVATTFVSGMLVLVTLQRAQRHGDPALAVLHLRAGASQQQIELAYRVLAQSLLLRVRTEPNLIRQLDDLDKAYIQGMRSLHAERAHPNPARNGLAGKLGRVSGTITAPFARLLVQASSAMLEKTGRLALGVAYATRTAFAEKSQEWRTSLEDREQGTLESHVDVERRLSVGLQTSTMQLARVAPSVANPPVGRPRTKQAFLLLESPVGTRRVALSERPIVIGSSPKCDVVLRAADGVATEHALVWLHGTQILLHVSDLDASCTVNGAPSTWAMLAHDDVLVIGQQPLRVQAEDGDVARSN